MPLSMIVFGILVAVGLLGFIYITIDTHKANEAIIKEARKEVEEGLEEVRDRIEKIKIRRLEEAKKEINQTFLEKMTKHQIEDLADQYDIQVSIYKRKDLMIQDFLTALNNK